jgi:hypothetical protein
VRIVKNLTNIVFGNLPDPEDVDLYAEVYNDLKNDGELKDNAKWAEALRDMYVVYTCCSHYPHVISTYCADLVHVCSTSTARVRRIVPMSSLRALHVAST